MRLSVFIEQHLDEILVDWVSFAREQQPAAASMDEQALLDHARQILNEIAANMRRPQGEVERRAKSEGNSARISLSPNLPSRSHARQRERQGFLIEQMIAEYRALRATVMRLWAASPGVLQIEDFEDVTRFHEAVDQAIAESVEVFVVEVDKARDLFLGVLGHDLRGPLSAVFMTAQLLGRTHPDAGRSVDVVKRSVAHMRALLDDLRVYTGQRLGAGFPIAAAPVQLDQLVRHTMEEADVLAAGTTLELEAAGDLMIECDSERLHQAVSNLLFNALKYASVGSRIRIGLDGTQLGEVVVSVHNTGSRIPDGMLTKIFDPLVRATEGDGMSDALQAGANLGLGLYVVREIASAHGGTVEVTSDESGTQFDLRLPRSAERARQSA